MGLANPSTQCQNEFLHGTLTEIVYFTQSTGFFDLAQPNFMCCLKKSLCNLKQAPRAWYNKFARYLLFLGFYNTLITFIRVLIRN
jgi:hypothetical protein